jgi:hypothetical protein
MNSNGKISAPTVPKSRTFWEIITEYDALFVFAILIGTIFTGIIIASLFQIQPGVRPNLLFNAAGAIGMAVLFVYLIFTFIGAKVNIMGKELDLGMFVYILIVLFVVFVLGN